MSYQYSNLKRHRSDERLDKLNSRNRNISVSMFESLQGSTDKLSSTLETLTKSVNLLKSLQPDVQRICTITQTERKYEILTDKEIEQAGNTISNETTPKINMLLKDAQGIIDNLGNVSRDIEKKVDEQDVILRDQSTKDQKGISPSPLSDIDQQKLADLRKRTKRYQIRQEYLVKEINEYDTTLQKLELELEQLSKEMTDTNRKQYQLEDEKNGQSSTEIMETYNLEEKRLLEELEDLELQLKIDNTEIVNANDNSNDDMDICEESITLQKSDYKNQLSIIQQLYDYLKINHNAYNIRDDDLEKYLSAIEHDKAKFNQVSHLKDVLENNTKQLISCSKTLMSQNNMGFVAQKLIEKIFKKEQSLISKELLLTEFQSSRQKEIAQLILDKYDFSLVLK